MVSKVEFNSTDQIPLVRLRMVSRFFGILSSIGIDASKGAYPTLDLNFEGVGQVEIMAMGVGGADEDPSAHWHSQRWTVVH